MIEQSLSFLTVHDVAHRESLLIYSVLSCWHVVQTQYSPQPQDVRSLAEFEQLFHVLSHIDISVQMLTTDASP